MKCPFCEHPTTHKHHRTSKGSQRRKCVSCKRTFTETLDTLYYRRQVSPEEIETILQSHAEGSSLRGVSRISKRAYGTVVSIVRAASHKAQQVTIKKFAQWSARKSSPTRCGRSSLASFGSKLK